MAALATFQTLLNAGLLVQQAFAASGESWPAFVGGAVFKSIEPNVVRRLRKLQAAALLELLHEVQRAKHAFLAGRALGRLSSQELCSYFDLLETERLLLTKALDPAWRSNLVVLTLDMLPTFRSVAGVLMPLLR